MEHISKIIIGLAAIYISLHIIGFGIRNVDAEDMGIHSYKLYDDFTYKKLIDDYVDGQEKEKLQEQYEAYLEQYEREMEVVRRREDMISRGSDRGIFTATAYDLTVTSTGKKESHPAYGITKSGISLKGQTLESARAIAVDPKIIPLNSKVYIEFLDDEYKHLEGIYDAIDTGSAIKGKKIDIFFGDTGDSKTDQAVWDFGRRKVKLTILE